VPPPAAPTQPHADSALQELEESRAIFRRLVTRDLYRLVDSTLIAWDTRESVAAAVTPEAIVAAVQARFVDAVPAPALLDALAPAHVVVDVSSMHYGMKAANPLATVRFYSKTHPHGALAVDNAHFSTSLPAQFAEASLRVYTRDARFFGLVQAGFRAVLAGVPGFAATPTAADDEVASAAAGPSRTASLATLPFPGTPPAPSATPGGSAGGETPTIRINPLNTVPVDYPPASPTRAKRVRTASGASVGARDAKRRG
jgi:hypothetical protein